MISFTKTKVSDSVFDCVFLMRLLFSYGPDVFDSATVVRCLGPTFFGILITQGLMGISVGTSSPGVLLFRISPLES